MIIILDYLISVIWLSPLLYLFILGFGVLFNRTRKTALLKQKGQVDKKGENIIFQIPTIGNVKSVNKILETVRNYALPMPVETWVIIEDSEQQQPYRIRIQVYVYPNLQ